MITKPTLKQFETRKQDHIRLALDPANQALGQSGLECIELIHEALPEINFAEVDISTERFGQAVTTPFLVSSMTAGHAEAVNINQILAKACQLQGWAMGVGSQRRQLFDAQASSEWQVLRQVAPEATLFGNIGISQIITTPVSEIERLVESIQARAMIVHTNPLQECLQPEGTPNFKGSLKALEQLCQQLSVPVILKETGCGFSAATLQRLMNIGLAAVDISGLGGTHWGRIEGQRSASDDTLAQAAQTFKNWGISTVRSLQEAVALKPNYEVWGSGGVRSGLDAAKLLTLGAQTIGFAKPMLEAALGGVDNTVKLMQTLEYELKVALFCSGHNKIPR